MTAREALEMVMDALYDDRTAIEKGLVAARVMNLDDAKKMTDVMNELPNLDGHQTPEEFKAERVAFMQGELEHNGDMHTLVRKILAEVDK